MTQYLIGQRVRLVYSKIQGDSDVGVQGVVCEVGLICLNGMAGIRARLENGRDAIAPFSYWGPILDRHQPCDAEFKESLDKLLEGLPA